MTVSYINVYSDNNGSSQNNAISIASVAMVSGDKALLVIWRRPKAPTVTAGPAWNGQTFTQKGTTIDTGEASFDLWELTASSSTTANITATFSDFAFYSAAVIIGRGSGGTVSLSAVSQQIYNTGTFTNPSLTVSSVPSGALLIDVLAAMGWNTSYDDVSATTWAPTATSRLLLTNTGQKAVTTLRMSTTAGAGSNITSGWSPNANQPMYSHFAMYMNDAPAYTIDTLSSPVNVGGTGYTGSTTNLGTITGLVFSGKSATIAGTSTNSFSWSMPTFQNGVTYPPMGSQSFTASDGTNNGSRSSVINTLSGYTAVTMGTMDTGTFSIGKDPAIVSGSVIHAPTAAGTLNNDGTLTDYVFGSYSCWMRDASDGKMYAFAMNVTNNGVSVGGLFRRLSVGIRIGI